MRRARCEPCRRYSGTSFSEVWRQLASDPYYEFPHYHYGGRLSFDIHARDRDDDPWARLGNITFTRSVASDSGDHRLHFRHPPWRKDI